MHRLPSRPSQKTMMIDIWILCQIYPTVLIADHPRYIITTPIPRLNNGIHSPIGYTPSWRRHRWKWLDLLYERLPIQETPCQQTGDPHHFWCQWRWGQGQKRPVLYKGPGSGGVPLDSCVGHPYPLHLQRIWRLVPGLPPQLQLLFPRRERGEIDLWWKPSRLLIILLMKRINNYKVGPQYTMMVMWIR